MDEVIGGMTRRLLKIDKKIDKTVSKMELIVADKNKHPLMEDVISHTTMIIKELYDCACYMQDEMKRVRLRLGNINKRLEKLKDICGSCE